MPAVWKAWYRYLTPPRCTYSVASEKAANFIRWNVNLVPEQMNGRSTDWFDVNDHVQWSHQRHWTSNIQMHSTLHVQLKWPSNLKRHTHTHTTHTRLSGTTRVGRYQKKHSPTHTHPDRRTSFIIFLHLQRSTAYSLFSLRAWQSSLTTSLKVLFGLPLGLGPSTSYSVHFFTESSSSFRKTCQYHSSLFCCAIKAMSSIRNLSLSSLLGSLSFNLTPHIHLTILISARWSTTTFSFLIGQVSLPCNIHLCTQLLYNFPLIIRHVLIGKQWYQLPAFIPTNWNFGLHSCISISIHSACHLGNRTYPLTTLHWPQ